MQCHRHRERMAVGICRACGKGVCDTDCAIDLGYGLACGEECAARIGHVEALNHRATASFGAARRNLWIGPLFFAAMGAAFLYFGWIEHGGFDFALVLGALFVAFAGVVLWRNRSWSRATR